MSPSRILGTLRVYFSKEPVMEKTYSRDGYTFASSTKPTRAEWVTMTGEVRNIKVEDWR